MGHVLVFPGENMDTVLYVFLLIEGFLFCVVSSVCSYATFTSGDLWLKKKHI